LVDGSDPVVAMIILAILIQCGVNPLLFLKDGLADLGNLSLKFAEGAMIELQCRLLRRRHDYDAESGVLY
jgi:hypothetical protein